MDNDKSPNLIVWNIVDHTLVCCCVFFFCGLIYELYCVIAAPTSSVYLLRGQEL